MLASMNSHCNRILLFSAIFVHPSAPWSAIKIDFVTTDATSTEARPTEVIDAGIPGRGQRRYPCHKRGWLAERPRSWQTEAQADSGKLTCFQEDYQ